MKNPLVKVISGAALIHFWPNEKSALPRNSHDGKIRFNLNFLLSDSSFKT